MAVEEPWTQTLPLAAAQDWCHHQQTSLMDMCVSIPAHSVLMVPTQEAHGFFSQPRAMALGGLKQMLINTGELRLVKQRSKNPKKLNFMQQWALAAFLSHQFGSRGRHWLNIQLMGRYSNGSTGALPLPSHSSQSIFFKVLWMGIGQLLGRSAVATAMCNNASQSCRICLYHSK